jgi:streptogramin lyase
MRIRPKSLLPIVLAFLGGSVAHVTGQTITEFVLPAGSNPYGITAGPDGNVWFTEQGLNPKIGRITPTGTIDEFSLPQLNAMPVEIVAGPDGNLWFTGTGRDGRLAPSYIGQITPAGVVTQFPKAGQPWGITVGADGNIWFTDRSSSQQKIWRMTTAGVLTGFAVPDHPYEITTGGDGNLWFTVSADLIFDEDAIGRMTLGGVPSEFSIPTAFEAFPYGITAGPDGNLWFTENDAGKIGRITTAGVVTQFSLSNPGSEPAGITAGPDGALWFTERSANKIGRITPTGVITEFAVPTPSSGPSGITAGPDGNIWFTEFNGNKIGRLAVSGAPMLETRILPVVGSTVGVGGSFFRTSVQLHNPTSAAIAGQIVYHPSGSSGSGSDPALSYVLSPGQTQSIIDLLPAMGRSGLGSADIEVTTGSIPAATVRVFNDAGAAGTAGFTEEPMRAQDALRPGQLGVLLLPTDLTNFRFNLGVRTLEGGATATLTLRDASGAIVAAVPRGLPTTYHEQQSAAAFLGVSTLPTGGSIEIVVSAGTAIFYGASVDNRTGDPSFQIARGPWDY